jgi:hypothetical protein
MSTAKFKSSLLLISGLAATSVLAHGPAHDRPLPRLADKHDAQVTTDKGFFPAYLLAEVCGLHEHHHGAHGHTAFKQRVELVKLAQAREPVFDDDPPLYDNLGHYRYPITTNSPMAQRYFDQGLRLAYAFNHIEAWRAFRKAQQLDPKCAKNLVKHPTEPFCLGGAKAWLRHQKSNSRPTASTARVRTAAAL